MSYAEPSLTWQEQQHRRIVQRDVTAFAELCEVALPHLVTFLKDRFPHQETHFSEMAAIDCLLNYQSRPEQYDPERLSLFAYLRMAARGDMLNLIDKSNRRARRLLSIDAPGAPTKLLQQDTIADAFELDEWLQQYTDLSRQELLQTLAAELDEEEEQILLLMLAGVRDSGQFAQVMGVDHLPVTNQRQEVKRAKDRLAKKLQRFSRRIGR